MVRSDAGSSEFRVDRSISSRVGVYRGGVRIEAGARPVDVPAFREAVVAAGAVPRAPVPLTISPADPWDLRLLGDAIELGLHLVELQRGFRSQVAGRSGLGPLLARALPGGFRPRLVSSLLSRHGPGDVLLALALAARVASTGTRSPAALAGDLLTLRTAGRCGSSSWPSSAWPRRRSSISSPR